MRRAGLWFLNYLMHAVHLVYVVFFLVGWAFPATRTAHILVSAATLVSWFGIGLFIRQPGFCIATEAQYQIRSRLGLQSERESYLVYMVRILTGRTVTQRVTDIAAQIVFFTLAPAAVVLKLWS